MKIKHIRYIQRKKAKAKNLRKKWKKRTNLTSKNKRPVPNTGKGKFKPKKLKK